MKFLWGTYQKLKQTSHRPLLHDGRLSLPPQNNKYVQSAFSFTFCFIPNHHDLHRSVDPLDNLRPQLSGNATLHVTSSRVRTSHSHRSLVQHQYHAFPPTDSIFRYIYKHLSAGRKVTDLISQSLHASSSSRFFPPNPKVESRQATKAHTVISRSLFIWILAYLDHL